MHDPFANPTLTTEPSKNGGVFFAYPWLFDHILTPPYAILHPNFIHFPPKVTMLQIYGTSLCLEAIEVLFESQLGSLGFGARYHGAADGVWRLKDLGAQLTDAVEAVAEGMELRLGKNDRNFVGKWDVLSLDDIIGLSNDQYWQIMTKNGIIIG